MQEIQQFVDIGWFKTLVWSLHYNKTIMAMVSTLTNNTTSKLWILNLYFIIKIFFFCVFKLFILLIWGQSSIWHHTLEVSCLSIRTCLTFQVLTLTSEFRQVYNSNNLQLNHIHLPSFNKRCNLQLWYVYYNKINTHPGTRPTFLKEYNS